MSVAELIAQSPKQLRSPCIGSAGVWLRCLISGLWISVLLLATANLRLWLLFLALPSSSDFCWHYAVFFLNSLSWPSSLAFDFFSLRTLILDFNRSWNNALLLESVSSSATLSFCPWSQWLTASDSYSHPTNPLVSWNSWSGRINCPLRLPLISAFFLMYCNRSVWQITLVFCDLNTAARGHIILFASWLLLDLTFFRLPCLISHGTFCPVSRQFWVLGVSVSKRRWGKWHL